MTALPERSEIVIIGGGVVGCSIAYQLARRGKTDVTVIERRRLTEGSTWHAAGLIGQLRSSSSLTALMRASVATYQALERETGYATGWHQAGSIRVAASDARWQELKRLMTAARSFGFEAHLLSAAQASEPVSRCSASTASAARSGCPPTGTPTRASSPTRSPPARGRWACGSCEDTAALRASSGRGRRVTRCCHDRRAGSSATRWSTRPACGARRPPRWLGRTWR